TTQSDFVTKVIRTNSGLCLMFDIEKLFQTQSQNHETKGISTVQDQAKEHIVTKRENYIQLVTFELSGGIYAFKIDDVQEIIRYVEPTKIPGVPEYVRGLAELREKVLPIIDLRELLELPSTQIDEFTKVIVLKVNNTLVGVVVDRIREVLRIEESKMLPPPTISQEGYSQELLGIVHIDEQMTMVLDHKTLLADKIQSLVETQQHIEEIEDRTITEEEKQYVIFKVGGEEYGVHIEEIREINRLTTLTKVPRAPDYLVGLMNLRGEILPVIDLRKRFGLPIDEKNDLMVRAIVTESSGKKTAFIVDSVVGVQRISIKSIADIPEAFTFGESARFVSKIARIDDRVILLLQMDKILTEQEQKVIQKTVENSDISKVDKKKNLKRR
ncbi:MAG TPA: chemotaxis protein CheW, partial [Pseudothermotoga sp.]